MPGPGPHLMYAMGSGLALTTLSAAGSAPTTPSSTRSTPSSAPTSAPSPSGWTPSSASASAPSSPTSSTILSSISSSWVFLSVFSTPGFLEFCFKGGCLIRFLGCPLLRSNASCWCQLVLFHTSSLITCSRRMGIHQSIHGFLSTGWWEGRAPVNPDAVVVVGILCIILIGGLYTSTGTPHTFGSSFPSSPQVLDVYVDHLVRPHRSITKQSIQSAILIAIVALLYSLWCASQIFWVNPRRPAVGEEADYGVLVFLAKYFFLPHLLCILSMHPRDLEAEQIPP
ncbi:hypothetical protein DVH24_008385 [Malus domestica]|uniref:Uncharacterized protein n=1 Tax=Malus domestica TaxID=3750 RepID=A0A498JLE3_MALDO|nr:hypothetical protein DVH24_008385 [Malus domestica]